MKKIDAGTDLDSDLSIANIYAGQIENTDAENVKIKNTNAYISLGYKF
ncbi:hypothetical protein [Dysgonomonas termitidis]|uniref:Outer membrane protein beta-barrel domain-containing protein n=1 Tax=Dysgonomonas termitidis TaxID=1516126 RepID=A0ABV9KRK3_9BACT